LSRFDLLVRGGTLVTMSGCEPGDVGVVDGIIAAVEPGLEGGADEVVDATGRHVFPGVVDAHVHCNDPGGSEWERFAHGTRALAARHRLSPFAGRVLDGRIERTLVRGSTVCRDGVIVGQPKGRLVRPEVRG
jgi:dihydroorotase-like cyclic amidohydrolase